MVDVLLVRRGDEKNLGRRKSGSIELVVVRRYTVPIPLPIPNEPFLARPPDVGLPRWLGGRLQSKENIDRSHPILRETKLAAVFFAFSGKAGCK